ncbi:MAG: hypothetical protein DGJ47_000893 [Rickettsiaceae bacterium]
MWASLIFLIIFNVKHTFADNVFSQGNNKIAIKYDRHIYISLSDIGINHLHFEDERVEKIIGDSLTYSAIVSRSGSDLFLTSKLEAGKKINLFVELSSGFVVDVIAHIVKSKHPRIIYLKHNSDSIKKIKERKLEAKLMIQAMRHNNKGKYYKKNLNRNLNLPFKDSLKIKQYLSYRFASYRGAGFNVHNTSKTNSITILPQEVANHFELVISTKVENTLLKPGQKTRIFIVWEGNND